jgi:hypothetical protein
VDVVLEGQSAAADVVAVGVADVVAPPRRNT